LKKHPFSFYAWIDENGLHGVAKLLKCHYNTVYYWRTGRWHPRPEQMREIKRLTKGKITYEDILDRQMRKDVKW
jgi:DNA-binding transcriptional regulator YdaS (Cro superfamily)